jgi:hypothetical protein
MSTSTPTITQTGTLAITYTFTKTSTPYPTSTITLTPVFTMTMTSTVTNSPTPSGTWYTSTSTSTPTPSDTPTNTDTPTITSTPTVTWTPNATLVSCDFLYDLGHQGSSRVSGSYDYTTVYLQAHQAAFTTTLYAMSSDLLGGNPLLPIRYITGIYDDDGSGTKPTTLLAETGWLSSSLNGWTNDPLDKPVPIVSGHTYWLAWRTSLGFISQSLDTGLGTYQTSVQNPITILSSSPTFATASSRWLVNIMAVGCPGPHFTSTVTPTSSPTPYPTFAVCPYKYTLGHPYSGSPRYIEDGIALNPYQATFSTTLYEMDAYCGSIGATFHMAIYDDDGSGTTPNHLLSETGEKVVGSVGMYQAPLLSPVDVTAGNTYWIGISSQTLNYFKWDNSSNITEVDAYVSSDGTPPSVIGASGSEGASSSYPLVVFASGCPGPTPSMTPTGTWSPDTPTITPTPTIIYTPTPTAT